MPGPRPSVQVSADDLKAGEPLVVRGNAMLSDGTEVEIEEAPTSQPAATQPAQASDEKPEAKQ